jgi:hypothetical protein
MAICLVCHGVAARSRASGRCGGARDRTIPDRFVSVSFLLNRANYLRSRLVESCYLHTLVIKADTRVYFAPVRAVIVTAPYSAFWLNTCVVYSVDLSHRSQAIPEVSYPFTLRSRTVHSRLDSFVCVSR